MAHCVCRAWERERNSIKFWVVAWSISRGEQAWRLEHFHICCIPYPQWANQAEAFCEVMEARACATAASRTSTVRAWAERSDCFTFAQHCSIGLKSGEDGGRESRSAPPPSIPFPPPRPLWAAK